MNPSLLHRNYWAKSGINAHAFDGEDDYLAVSASSDFLFDGDFAVSQRVNYGFSTPKYSLQFGNIGNSPADHFYFDFEDSGYGVWAFWATGGAGLRTTTNFNDNKDHDIIISRIGSLMSLYIDSQLLSTKSFSDVIGNDSDPLIIGKSTLGTPFEGKIFDLRIWNGSGLTQGEVDTISGGGDITSDLVLNMPLDVSNIGVDISGNGHVAVPFNF